MADIVTAEQLAALPESETVTREVQVPGWPGAVVIRQFSLLDQRELRDEARTPDGELDQTLLDAATLERALVQPKIDRQTALHLLRTRFGPVQYLLNEIHRLSGLTELLEISAGAVAATERRFRQRG